MIMRTVIRLRCQGVSIRFSTRWLAIGLGMSLLPFLHAAIHAENTAAVVQLAHEVHDRGWIVFAARSDQSDWDLFLSRPDGSKRRNITRTRDANEAAPQFSRDGSRLLYRKLPPEETIDGNDYGAQGSLVLANSDGTDPRTLAESGEYPWASWSPDGKQIACLSIRGISVVDLASLRVVRILPRQGFFQQMTWSPDGNRLAGVTNAHGTSWSVACLDLAGGESSPVSRVDCCTPDWFPDSRRLIFSNRPRGQPVNDGYGWTQLWMADDQGRSRQLIFAEDGRHIYGGKISPDGRYVLFTGNVKENGDPEHRGAPMGLMRLADAPIVGGSSPDLRKLYPEAKRGPVLKLPVGWEPDWTAEDLSLDKVSRDTFTNGDGRVLEDRLVAARSDPKTADSVSDIAVLARELSVRGWIAFAAPSGQGDWDLYRMRPDGSSRHPLTNTRRHNEAGVRFSPDGRHILYYRLPKREPITPRMYVTGELIVADADGGNPVSHGTGTHWATWGPDGKEIACLGRRNIQIVDLKTQKVLQQLPRNGVVWQLIWSPDGHWFVGTANGLGPYWNIARVDRKQAVINRVSEPDRYNCTPDWMPDSRRILYARGIVPEVGGWAELWVADGQGAERQMLYSESGRHIYGGCASPDGQYLIFTRSVADQHGQIHAEFHLAIIRWKDTPMVGGRSADPLEPYPETRRGPRLDLGVGWEPHWTFAEPSSTQE